MSAQYPLIAAAFIAGTRVPRHASLYPAYFHPDPAFIGGVNTNRSGDHPAPAALYSYGPHFPILIEASETFAGGWWLNESDYHPSEEDRYNAGWGLGTPRRPKISPTTRKQRTAIENALRATGYAPTDATRIITTENTDGDPTPYTFRHWVKA